MKEIKVGKIIIEIGKRETPLTVDEAKALKAALLAAILWIERRLHSLRLWHEFTQSISKRKRYQTFICQGFGSKYSKA